jgi:predicted nucleic acid-binding protein
VADVLVDTDIFIDHLRGKKRIASGNETIRYSVITRCELFAGRATDERRVEQILAPFKEIAVDRAIGERAGRLRRTLSIRTPDALIAATALEHNLALVTRNVRDYTGVPGLRLLSEIENA